MQEGEGASGGGRGQGGLRWMMVGIYDKKWGFY